ncbi:MAG TPA: peptide ABC transporter substrate-binding protein [Rhizomicrobium sp.]|jgi:oligopeptide transport system substrate-binding protein|nr:peptide ABC transporter substrate-binding protein [Rhizomicrobium sp.]
MTLRAVIGLALLVLAGTAQAQTELRRGNGAEPDSLDPQFVGGTAEENILNDLMVGLVTLDAAARPIPGVAESWTVSPDGKRWSFHLRKAAWSDGKPVSADDFVFAYRRLLDPKTASRYAYNLWVIKNARAVSGGKLPLGALGVEAPRPDTLILTLEHPAPYLPELLTHPSAMPLPRSAVEAKDAGWARPGNYVSDGPYQLKDWVPNDHITLMKNPRFYDAANVRIASVVYFPTSDADAALRRFRAGELDMQTPVPMSQTAWLKANMPGVLRITPSLAIDYIAINLSDAPLKDARVRRAINLAYDREAVTQKVLKQGEPPAYSYVPPGTANYPGSVGGARSGSVRTSDKNQGAVMDFRGLPPPARLAEAQTLMRDAGYGPFQRLHLNYETTINSDNRRLAAIFQAMLKPIYIDLGIQTVELQIHLRDLRLHQFELASANWFADFNDASNFLDLLRSDSGNNYAGYRNPHFDAAMDAADKEPDAARRGRALAGAEAIALKDYPWVPLRFPAQSDVVGPRVMGWTANARDFQGTRWLWLK